MMDDVYNRIMNGEDRPLWDSKVFKLFEKPELNVIRTHFYELPVPSDAWCTHVVPSLLIINLVVRVCDSCIVVYQGEDEERVVLFELYPQYEDIDRFEYNVACDMWSCLGGLTLPYIMVGKRSVLVKLPLPIENEIFLAKVKRPYTGMFI